MLHQRRESLVGWNFGEFLFTNNRILVRIIIQVIIYLFKSESPIREEICTPLNFNEFLKSLKSSIFAVKLFALILFLLVLFRLFQYIIKFARSRFFKKRKGERQEEVFQDYIDGEAAMPIRSGESSRVLRTRKETVLMPKNKRGFQVTSTPIQASNLDKYTRRLTQAQLLNDLDSIVGKIVQDEDSDLK